MTSKKITPHSKRDPYLTLKGSVMLTGNPIFSLDYFDGSSWMKSDILAYRPNPLNYLDKGTEYKASLKFIEIIDWQNNKSKSLKSITIEDSNKRYILSKLR
jgi:hypothetical protein